MTKFFKSLPLEHSSNRLASQIKKVSRLNNLRPLLNEINKFTVPNLGLEIPKLSYLDKNFTVDDEKANLFVWQPN